MKVFFVSLFIFTIVASCSINSDVPFSMLPGFQIFYQQHPRSHHVPNHEEKTLLQRFKPRFYRATEQSIPVDFYLDYIAKGTLYSGDGKVITKNPSQGTLNSYRADPSIVFVYEGNGKMVDNTMRSPGYARIDYGSLPDGSIDIVFLSYNLVFPYSGLPSGLNGFLDGLAGIFASTKDWHQLDIYVAATIALNKESLQPIAVTLQQHNITRTFLFGSQLPLPEDNRVQLDIAMRSNELYPHQKGRTARRAISFPSASGYHYLITGEDAPFLATNDVTDGSYEIEYDLMYLPPSDAFYAFVGTLGEQRLLPGRSGSPGADFNTWPTLKDKAVTLVTSYIRPGNDVEYIELFRDWEQQNDNLDYDYSAFTNRFVQDASLR